MTRRSRAVAARMSRTEIHAAIGVVVIEIPLRARRDPLAGARTDRRTGIDVPLLGFAPDIW